jgi:hypothetical protein
MQEEPSLENELQPEESSSTNTLESLIGNDMSLSVLKKKLPQEIWTKFVQEQNLSLAIIGGLGVAIVSAFIWALITYYTKYQIGYMAIAVGAAVGFTVRFLGKGLTPLFGIIGAGFALFGCLLGNLFSQVGFLADSYSVSYVTIFSWLDPVVLKGIFTGSFNAMDLLFYGLAIYEGFRFSFRSISKENIVAKIQQ